MIPIDLAFVIQKLVSLGWFTLASYNRALENFKFSSEEKKSRPQSVPDKAKKLKGKAISHWIHIRNFPLILMLNGWVMDSDNPVLRLGIKLNELTYNVKEHQNITSLKNRRFQTIPELVF